MREAIDRGIQCPRLEQLGVFVDEILENLEEVFGRRLNGCIQLAAQREVAWHGDRRPNRCHGGDFQRDRLGDERGPRAFHPAVRGLGRAPTTVSRAPPATRVMPR